jgi:hypothetical protein
MVTVMFTVFVPFSFFAGIPLTIVPLITVMLVPFAVVSARYGPGGIPKKSCRESQLALKWFKDEISFPQG